MKKLKSISTKQLMYFVGVGISIALAICLVIATFFANRVGNEIEIRDIEFLFGAVESGPLAIAKLQSAAIAQQTLNRIMSNPKFEQRGIEVVEILGGENASYLFASWKSSNSLDPSCLLSFNRVYSFQESINSFEIKITKNKCFIINEKKLIFWSSGLTSFLAAIISIIIISFSVWPVGSSIRHAERLLVDSSIGIENISFTPIKDLVVIAQRSIELEKGKVLTDLARQVSHDIQSPLSVLNLVTHNLDIPSEKLSLIRGSVQRITEIADTMLKKSKIAPNVDEIKIEKDCESEIENDVTSVIPLVEALILEKRIEFKSKANVKIDLEIQDTDLKSNIPRINLSRLLSNLINNAVESISTSGCVKVCIKASEYFNIITVSDNGVGIPEDALENVGKKGISIGKINGNGLGIYSAKKLIADIGGKFEIHSVHGAGTLITVKLPRIT